MGITQEIEIQPGMGFRITPNLKSSNICDETDCEWVYNPIGLFLPGYDEIKVEPYQLKVNPARLYERFTFPLGEVFLRFNQKNKPLRSTSPVGFTFSFSNLTSEQSERIRLSSISAGVVYNGIPDFDGIGDEPDQQSSMIIHDWMTIRSTKSRMLFFPPNPTQINQEVEWILRLTA